MFEESLVESCVFHVSSSKRWTTITSIGLQVSLAISYTFSEGSPVSPGKASDTRGA
jgi:hypothetical protein